MMRMLFEAEKALLRADGFLDLGEPDNAANPIAQASEFFDKAGVMDEPAEEMREQLTRQLDAGYKGGRTTILERATSADRRNAEMAFLTLRMQEIKADIVANEDMDPVLKAAREEREAAEAVERAEVEAAKRAAEEQLEAELWRKADLVVRKARGEDAAEKLAQARAQKQANARSPTRGGTAASKPGTASSKPKTAKQRREEQQAMEEREKEVQAEVVKLRAAYAKEEKAKALRLEQERQAEFEESIKELSNGVYEGAFLDGKRHGLGVRRYGNGDVYTGGWKAGKKNGHGTIKFADSSVYTGHFHEGYYHGQGELVSNRGHRYVGQWVGGKREGHGVYTWPDGARYEGDYWDGKPHGHGTRDFASGARYVGEWQVVEVVRVWGKGFRVSGFGVSGLGSRVVSNSVVCPGISHGTAAGSPPRHFLPPPPTAHLTEPCLAHRRSASCTGRGPTSTTMARSMRARSGRISGTDLGDGRHREETASRGIGSRTSQRMVKGCA
jgi:hypothetical protein